MKPLYWLVSLINKNFCPDCGGRRGCPRRVFKSARDRSYGPGLFDFVTIEQYGACENPIHSTCPDCGCTMHHAGKVIIGVRDTGLTAQQSDTGYDPITYPVYGTCENPIHKEAS